MSKEHLRAVSNIASLCESLLDASPAALHSFACWCADRSLSREREVGREPDQRSWNAIAAKRAWLRGEIGDEQLAAAQLAASVATRTSASADGPAGTAVSFAADVAHTAGATPQEWERAVRAWNAAGAAAWAAQIAALTDARLAACASVHAGAAAEVIRELERLLT